MRLLVKILHDKIEVITVESKAIIDAILGTIYAIDDDDENIFKIDVWNKAFRVVGRYSRLTDGEYEYSKICYRTFWREALIYKLAPYRICSIECL
jgi:hypothetical protein